MRHALHFSTGRGHSIIGHGERALPVLLNLLRDLRLDMHGILIDSQGGFGQPSYTASDSWMCPIEILLEPGFVWDAGQDRHVFCDVTRFYYQTVFSQVWLAFVLIDDLTEQECISAYEIVRMIKAEGGMAIGVATELHGSSAAAETDGHCNALLLRELDALLQMPSCRTPLYGEFVTCLADALAGIAYPLQGKGFIGIDLSDVRVVMTLSRNMTYGVGSAAGCDRVDCATGAALSSLSLGSKALSHAKGIFISIKGGVDFGLKEFNRVGDIFEELVPNESFVFIGTHTNPDFHDQLSVSVYVIN
jgi:hypothetical protein